MRGVDPQHDRRLPLVGALKLGEQRRVGACMDHLEGQGECHDALVVITAPGDRSPQIAAFGRGLGRGKCLGAGRLLQRFPVGQAWTLLLHVLWIPPFLLGLHAGCANYFGLSGGDRSIHRVPARGLPHLHRKVQVAGREPRRLGKVVGLHVFNVVAGFLSRISPIIWVVISCPVQSFSVSLIGSVDSCAAAGSERHAAASASADAEISFLSVRSKKVE